ncbi:hypothetical protein SmJEL517_g02188 [Synchytrium microbalum]|uniref:Uncharacterized protein n=1 Tax=Synchytrium microbalum TaxID=1806994 RepID=A0A507C7G2_9FUNG|nr:uncharacterized protein SmJEL517_g02188 [Synchytrium microbalum]TPX35441.1 hypothetical protein SmJEL517_g02188 [Synchytrium microbalum]
MTITSHGITFTTHFYSNRLKGITLRSVWVVDIYIMLLRAPCRLHQELSLRSLLILKSLAQHTRLSKQLQKSLPMSQRATTLERKRCTTKVHSRRSSKNVNNFTNITRLSKCIPFAQ